MSRIIALLLSALLVFSVAAVAQKNVSDDEIYDQVRRRLATDPKIRGGALNVEVKDAVVTLKGELKTDKQRVNAEKAARKVKGVTKVINEIVLKPTAP